jgi:hypothetical protein
MVRERIQILVVLMSRMLMNEQFFYYIIPDVSQIIKIRISEQ